jgi:hypothetical protein
MTTGRCLCGAVRYELTGTPIGMYHCHCSQCRHANGASFATNVIASAEDLKIVAGKDVLAAYESSPSKQRFFCSRCGSPIYSHAQATAAIVSVRAGTLDDDPGFRPNAHIHAASRAPWTEICDGLPQNAEGF